jgi:hypothetical protein
MKVLEAPGQFQVNKYVSILRSFKQKIVWLTKCSEWGKAISLHYENNFLEVSLRFKS